MPTCATSTSNQRQHNQRLTLTVDGVAIAFAKSFFIAWQHFHNHDGRNETEKTLQRYKPVPLASH